MWRTDLGRAVAESCAPARNWRWTLSSLGIGAGFGLIAGLHRLGNQPATITSEVALTCGRAALAFFAVGWLVAVAIRFGHRRWLQTK